MHDQGLLTYNDAAHYLGLTKNTLYSMVSRGQIPHFRLGPRLVRFSADGLRRWVAEKAVEPERPDGEA